MFDYLIKPFLRQSLQSMREEVKLKDDEVELFNAVLTLSHAHYSDEVVKRVNARLKATNKMSISTVPLPYNGRRIDINRFVPPFRKDIDVDFKPHMSKEEFKRYKDTGSSEE